MRIISGKYKGRQIHPPSKLPVRPTTDFAKTGLFNILESRFDLIELSCLDLFSGTGSISLELISRGCKNIISIDSDQQCVVFLRKMTTTLDIKNLTAHRSDAIEFVKKTDMKFDLIFADPPFESGLHEKLHELIMSQQKLTPKGCFIMEHGTRDKFEHLGGFEFSRKYGNVTFSFFFNLES